MPCCGRLDFFFFVCVWVHTDKLTGVLPILGPGVHEVLLPKVAAHVSGVASSTRNPPAESESFHPAVDQMCGLNWRSMGNIVIIGLCQKPKADDDVCVPVSKISQDQLDRL